jgi:dienelactone hydrolase
VVDVVLLHSTVGRRPAVLRAAQRLSAQGHRVTTPDLFKGEVFDDLEAGMTHADAIGSDELVRRCEAAVAELPSDVVLIGLSMGAGFAALLAANRPGALGVVLLYDAWQPEDPWPAGVPLQIHHSVADPFIEVGSSAAFVTSVASQGGAASLHLYPGNRHLLDYDDLPGQHDASSAALIWARVEAFLATL